ncbi:MAG: adenylate/guanylate cyclase domain-containing protein [Thermoflexaceae bacterium]|nr:adenylate/guanylate cyclase domain-containing protein [Thermoflexaceae bacterium]
MLRITLRGEGPEQHLEHAAGPLEFGRGPGREGVPSVSLRDPFASRDHLRVTWNGEVLLVENISRTSPVMFEGGAALAPRGVAPGPLPAGLRVGNSQVRLEFEADAAPAPAPVEAPVSLPEPAPPSVESAPDDPASGPRIEVVEAPAAAGARPVALGTLGEAPDAETLAHWFETLVLVQQAAASSRAFLDATAEAVVRLVGLDRGLVLTREDGRWVPRAVHPDGPPHFSSTIVAEVARRKQTVYRNFGAESLSLSLVGVDTVVAAPILDAAHEVVGIVYGARELKPGSEPPRVTRLEALVVQVLAAAVGAGLERQEQEARAVRSQVQFEQFFSPELARELASDASLLEGREREVTLLFTDVRNFSRISERLGAQRTFAMMQDVMELQTVRIREEDGVVVDYVGDGLLAMWNAPADQPDHPARACRAAVAFLSDLPVLSERWAHEAGEPIRLGTGIHTGVALVGNTGSRVKFKYGPMGSAVNLASRLENATKTLGVSPLISKATRDRLPTGFGTRRLGGLRVQGFAEAVAVFELFPGEPTAAWRARRDEFERALQSFEARQWADACTSLASLLSHGAEFDVPSLQLLARSVECLRSQPDTFDPALVITKQT